MSRKHYRILADMFYQLKLTRFNLPINRCWRTGLRQWKKDVLKISDFLTLQNPRFDRERFLNACSYYERA